MLHGPRTSAYTRSYTRRHPPYHYESRTNCHRYDVQDHNMIVVLYKNLNNPSDEVQVWTNFADKELVHVDIDMPPPPPTPAPTKASVPPPPPVEEVSRHVPVVSGSTATASGGSAESVAAPTQFTNSLIFELD